MSLVSDFLSSVCESDYHTYSIRDNCGLACIDFSTWCIKNHGLQLSRIRGYVSVDKVLADREDFTNTMRVELRSAGLNFNSQSDRILFLETNDRYCEKWKLAPHYWMIDDNRNLYDPSGKMQFIDSGFVGSLDVSKYNAEVSKNPSTEVGSALLLDFIGNTHLYTLDYGSSPSQSPTSSPKSAP